MMSNIRNIGKKIIKRNFSIIIKKVLYMIYMKI